jgi:3,4-dihydroxy 2-butanone 4-phosphate synthase/GTP cyclohydrolase II
MAAEFASAEKLAFIVRYSTGVVCAPLTDERCDELRLPLMVEQNTESQRTAFTDTVDIIEGTSTGISAADRAATLRGLSDPTLSFKSFARPGHIFPLRARNGGVLKRAGHTEASVDLARLAGCEPAAVICEIQNDDGTMMRLPDLRKFCAEHNLLLSSIAQLIEYRRHNERLVERMGEAAVPTEFGTFTCVAYKSTIDNIEHLAFVKGTITGEEPILVRVHSECLTGDVFGSRRCDCGPQLATAMQMVDEAGAGVIVYLRGHEGRGIGIGHKIRAYSLQDEGFDTVDANTELGLPIDSREYGIGAQILADLGVHELKLMTNNPAKYGGLGGYGLTVVERIPLNTIPTPENEAYLRTKRERMGHHIDMHDGQGEGK